MKKLLFLLLIITSCTAGAEMKSIQYDYLINDSNSKVWMIEKMIVNKTNITAQRDDQKELLIFYQTGNFQYIPIKQLGHKNGKKGSYFLSSEEKELKLYFKEDVWDFKLAEITEDSVYLVPTKESDVNFSILLVPLKELQFE